MSVTIKDIARALHISPSAVSLALNGKSGVSESTREKITTMAIEMGYLPSRQISWMKPSANIRFLIFLNTTNVVTEISFYSFVLHGIQSEAKELGYNVLVNYITKDADGNWQEDIPLIDTIGILALGTELHNNDINNEFFSAFTDHCPTIILDNNLFSSDIDCIATNNTLGSYQAIQHLIHSGHKHIGYLTSRQRIHNFDERATGVERAIQENPNVVFQKIPVTFSTSKAAQELSSWLLSNPNPPTAFFAESDIIAFGAMQAFNSYGYRVPEDISIIGFDDMPACDMVSPPLTSIHVSKERMGIMAVRQLHEKLTETHKPFPTRNTILSTFVHQRSTIKNLNDT